MNTRAAQQLRLQQAVEGLSVVAVSYYLAGLISYGGKAAKASGVRIDPDLVTGIAVPVVALFVWLGIRQLQRSNAKRFDEVFLGVSRGAICMRLSHQERSRKILSTPLTRLTLRIRRAR